MSRAPAASANPFVGDKIYGHLDRVREWMASGRSRPVTVEFDLTNLCDHRCPGCFGFNPARDGARMALEDARRILSEIREAGARALTFTGGGEPLTSPDAAAAVEHARGLGLDVGFITNGTALGAETAATLLRRCQWLRVSLDAATPETYRRTHGMDERTFARTLENIRTLVRLKREGGHACTLGVGFLTSKETKEDIVPFARLGLGLGVDYLQYRPLLRRPGEEEPLFADRELLEAMRQAAALATPACRIVCSEHKYRLIERGEVRRGYGKCYGQHFAAVVAADLKMYVCCHLRGVERYCVGDLSRHAFSQIWDSPERQRVAESVDFRDCPLLCRCDSFNGILWGMKRESLPAAGGRPAAEHPNFI